MVFAPFPAVHDDKCHYDSQQSTSADQLVKRFMRVKKVMNAVLFTLSWSTGGGGNRKPELGMTLE